MTDPELSSPPEPDAPAGLWARLAARPVVLVEDTDGPSLWDHLDHHLRLVKARPRLRADLVVSQQEEAGVTYYVLKDPVALAYYRFKANEYFILTLLDANHEVRDLVQAYSQQYRPIRPETVQGFLDKVEGFGLLEHGRQNLYSQLMAHLTSHVVSRLGALLRFNYTLPDTDGWTQRLYRVVRVLFSTPLVWFWSLLALSGLIPLVLGWYRLGSDLGTVFASGWELVLYALLLYGSVAVVIVVHELAHALTCVHFGGHVHKMGIMLYYITLAAYADTSDAWLFPSRWQRAGVSLAGPLSTLVFGSLGAWLWWLAPVGSMFSHLALMLMLATVPFSLANLNPFLEFDGYYVLSDLTGIPNLRRRSFEYSRLWLMRWVRRDQPVPPADAGQRRIFLAYGLLAAVYFVVFLVVPLALQIPALLQQFGPVLGGALVLVLVLLFSQRYIRALIQRWQARKKTR
ncbi:MAG: M50 family metallopeptidase [Chloroflexi bacterium]|nr:M50 family metallopeptidase [Chloroflexota bacterium]